MQNALRDAGLKPKDLHYINAHATSTPLGKENFNFSVTWKMRELIASLSPQSSPVVLLSNLSRSADVENDVISFEELVFKTICFEKNLLIFLYMYIFPL